MLYAFRCVTCGYLHTAHDAGEADNPHACRVCDAGVHFTTEPDKKVKELRASVGEHHNFVRFKVIGGKYNLHKIIDHTNWEVLAEATDERLEQLGLQRHQVVKHTPWPKGTEQEAKLVDAHAGDSPAVQDKAS